MTQDVYHHIYQLYITDKRTYNLHRMSKQFEVPYSSLRRAVMSLIKHHRTQDNITETTLPYRGFEYLEPGDTFQFTPTTMLWVVVRRDLADMEEVWLLKPEPTRTRGARHWLCGDLQ